MSGDGQRIYQHRLAEAVTVAAFPAELFAYLDDHERLGAHMMQSTAMMAGSAIAFTFDDGKGRALGSRIEMRGKVLGFSLTVSEIVTEREIPERKAWETQGSPRLLVIGAYRMGFQIAPEGAGSRLTVFIDYDLPNGPWRLLGFIAGRFYARWCVQSMARDAARAFAG